MTFVLECYCYHRAPEIFRQGMQLSATQNADYLPTAICLYTDLSEVLYEWNDLNGARRVGWIR